MRGGGAKRAGGSFVSRANKKAKDVYDDVLSLMSKDDSPIYSITTNIKVCLVFS